MSSSRNRSASRMTYFDPNDPTLPSFQQSGNGTPRVKERSRWSSCACGCLVAIALGFGIPTFILMGMFAEVL